MNPIEFLSILSTRFPNLTLKQCLPLQNTIDIYDFKKESRLIFDDHVPKESWFEDVFKDYEFLKKNNIHHLYPSHPEYPKDFYTLERPPLFLSAVGELSCLSKNKISIVGSRHPTLNTLEWMDTHLETLVNETGVVTVSGAARGIDQKAHSISLRNGKPTIAFLPSGLGQIYPSEFSRWKNKIIECGGLIVSEYGYNQMIHRHHFHERNRMIAKLGLFVFVCEARQKSGSIMTARLAIENCKTVCILPGFPTEKNRQGCLDLLFQGALPIRDYEDLKVLLEAEKASTLLFVPNQFKSVESCDKE